MLQKMKENNLSLREALDLVYEMQMNKFKKENHLHILKVDEWLKFRKERTYKFKE